MAFKNTKETGVKRESDLPKEHEGGRSLNSCPQTGPKYDLPAPTGSVT